MKATFDVALLGFGLAGRVFHAPLVDATPGLRLHTVVSSDPAKVASAYPQARVLADPQAAFADPDIDLVVVRENRDGSLFWELYNAMQSASKNLNKLRAGTLLYGRDVAEGE